MNATEQVAVPHRRWWLPSISQALWLAFLLGLFFSPRRQDLINTDGDACFHVRFGNWIIEHHEIVREEKFSHTRYGAQLITKEWLSEVMYAASWKVFGWNGVALVGAALIATSLWILHRQLLSEGNDILLSTALVLLAAIACSVHWLARPLLVTHVLVAWYGWQLRSFDREQLSALQLSARLVPWMIVWTNMHGAFPIGLALIGMYLVGNAVGLVASPAEWRPTFRNKIRSLGFVLAACLASTLINPNGWRLPAHILGFLRTPLLTAITAEFSSPDFHSNGLRGFLLLLLLLAVVLIVVRPRLGFTEMVLIGGWGFFALQSVRHVPIFAFVVTPILAEHLHACLRDAHGSAFMLSCRRISAGLTSVQHAAGGYALAAIGVVALLVVLTRSSLSGSEPLVRTGIRADRFPVDAVAFLRDHPDAVHGEMFNDYDWGGYLMLELPDRRVFVDGRNDFYGAELVREYLQASWLQPKWKSIFEKYGVGWVILPADHPLSSCLALQPDWELVRRPADPVAVIYRKTR